MKEIIITTPIPEGYEVDKERSTFECIKLKPIEGVETWEDIKLIKGYHINPSSNIIKDNTYLETNKDNKNVALTEKHVKSMLAFAQISQLMPYYGGEITQAEWSDESIKKYVIHMIKGSIVKDTYTNTNIYYYLVFHTKEQRDRFFLNNEQLIRDYYMID